MRSPPETMVVSCVYISMQMYEREGVARSVRELSIR